MAKKTRETGNGTVISGSNGDDFLDGSGASYILSGGNGNDTYVVDDIGDEVDEKNNGGIDHVVSYIDWWFGQHVENLTLAGTADLSGTGNESDNEITGNSGDNTLDGGAGDDSLYGGAGDDTLIGGAGADLIDGGSGSDTAIFAGSYGDYSFTWSGEELQVTNGLGEIDRLRDVEFLSFSDQLVAASDIGSGPQAVDDDDAGAEDSDVTIAVLNNDLGKGISVASATNGAMGVVIVNGDGTVTYRPNENASGTDTFSYTITDSNGLTSTASVTVDISAVNDAPVAEADSYSTLADQAFTNTVSVLDNDTDPDGDTLRITGYDTTTAAGGTVAMNSDGTFTYTPLAGFTGTDSFIYTADDGNGGQSSATVTLTVDPAAPEAVGDSTSVLEDGSVVVSVLDNDTGDGLLVTSATDGGIGSVTVNADDTVTYAPFADANGADSFTYTITDSLGRSATASVSVDVSPVNDAPVANADSFTTTEGTTLSGAVLGNDSDPDGDTLTVSAYAETSTAGGTVTMAADGSFSYTGPSGFTGTDSFSYTASDGNGGTATATVSVTVEAPATEDPDALPYYIEALLKEDASERLNYPDAYGKDVVVTFTFLGAVPDYYDDSSSVHDGFQPFNEQQREATRDALAAVSGFANVSFLEVTSPDDACLTFGFTETGGTAGSAKSSFGNIVGTTHSDIWISETLAGEAFVDGSSVYKTLIHEVGHVMGMDHPVYPGLPMEENNRAYTVMSAAKAPSLGYEPETYMLYDIATLQYIYGENSSYATGDDVYSFADFASKAKTVWDAGGHDVFDLSAATYGVEIDLREGGFSTIDPGLYTRDNLAIAFGTVIEDAVGGAYDDRITGNEADNRLTGGGGADVFAFATDWGGDTVTDFARGEDALDFSAAGLGFADLTITSSGGNTVLSHGGNSVVLEGVATIDESDLLVA